ncbi:hypothetical protein B0H14DRAFT_3452525 [Mycena olivaceomarginata]|nr:hypothetical protein B0H14DRAFT_3452525 [Mycena olivaceomarginata]
MSSSTISPAPTYLTAVSLEFVQHMLPTSAPTPALPPTAKWSPLTASEAHLIIQSELYPGISEIDRLARKMGRENTLKRSLHPIPDSVSAGSPLTQSEARAQDRLAHKMGRENTLQRTLHPIPASVVSVPGDARPAHPARVPAEELPRPVGGCAAPSKAQSIASSIYSFSSSSSISISSSRRDSIDTYTYSPCTGSRRPIFVTTAVCTTTVTYPMTVPPPFHCVAGFGRAAPSSAPRSAGCPERRLSLSCESRGKRRSIESIVDGC